MAQYKLIYFNLRGRAELARLVFAQAGVQYEDKRIPKEEWGELKPKTPFGVLPILEFDGHTLGGSVEIARFIAEKHGVAGSNAVENSLIAGLMDCLTDMQRAIMTFYFEKNETRKAELKKKLDEEDMPKYLSFLEKHVSADGWLFGSKVTYVDLAFYNFIQFMPSEVLTKFPKLKSVADKVAALPNIAKWIKERPETSF